MNELAPRRKRCLSFICALAVIMPIYSSAAASPPVGSSKTLDPARGLLEHAFRSGMSFLSFRRLVLAQGWVPISHKPPCLNQVDDHLCRTLPELFNTSSGPIEYNEMSYRNPATTEHLQVVVEGDISTWGTPDAAKELIVDSWDFGNQTDNP